MESYISVTDLDFSIYNGVIPYFKLRTSFWDEWKSYFIKVVGTTSVKPNIIFIIPLYFTGITTCIYTELAPKHTKTAFVAQSVEHWSRDAGSRVRFPVGGLGVAFFATGPVGS